jgi:predicted ATPase
MTAAVALDASAPRAGAPSQVGPRWESQGLTILRATLVPRGSPDEPVESARPLERLIQTVQSFGGSVETLDSRSILAIFGLRTVEDWSRRAAASAMASQLALRREEDNHFAVRAAIHSGHFLVGKIGGVAAMEEDGKREVSRTLEALLGHAEPDTIVVSEAAARLLERRFAVVPAGDLGETGEPVYRLAGRQASTFAIEGRVTTFVGRRDELGLLRSKYLLARSGRGEVVGIVGEAGIGKSRLLWEFRNSIREDAVIYLEGRCASYGSAVPYLPLLDVIRAYCGITDADGPAAMADRIRSAMLRVDLSVADAAPYILQLLGLTEQDDRLAMLGPETTRARTFDTLQQMLLKASKQQPLVLAVEDLHWSDKTSQEFLVSLVESMSGASLLLVVTYRPGYRLAGVEKSYATQIALDPLSPEDSLSVINGVVQQELLPGTLAEAILRRAEGNPFFLEELTRAVLEQSARTQVLSVPDSIHGVLMARLDRLLVDTKQVLQNASVLGRAFSSRLLGAIGKAPGGLDPHLHELERLEFIHKQPGAGEGRYVFKHALTHEVVYESLPTHRRTALHEAAGRAVEALYRERLDEHYELLAYHYGRSANQEKALEYLELANRKAGKVSAAEEAKAYFDEAMRVLDGMPDSEVNRGRRIALLVNQSAVMVLLLKCAECYELLTRYEPLAVRLGDPRLLGAFYGCLGYCLWSFGEVNRAMEMLDAGARLSETAGDAEAAGYTLMCLEWGHLWKGEYDKVLRYEERVLKKMEERFNLRTATCALAAASWAYSFLGCWNDAVREGERELRLAEEYADSSTIAFAAMVLSVAHTSRGDLARAIEYGETAVKRAVTPADRAWTQGVLGWALCRAGDPSRASDMLREVVANHRKAGFLGAEYYAVWLGEAYWRAGERQRAVDTLTEEVEIAERCGLRFFLASARRLLGEIALSDPTTEGRRLAQDHFSHSIDLLQEIGAENELALAYSGYAQLFRQSGDAGTAREYLTKALQIFDRLGTLIEPGRVRAELAQLEQHG